MKSLRAALYIYIASLMVAPARAQVAAPSAAAVRQLLNSSLTQLKGIRGLKNSAQSGIMLADLRVQKLPELWRMAGSVNHPSSATIADNTVAMISCAMTYSELQKLRAAAAAGKPDMHALETTEKYYQRNCVDTAIATAGADLFTGDLINTATKEWLALHMGGDLAVGRKNAEIMLASGAGFDGGSSGWGDFLNSLHGGSSSLSDGDDDASGVSFAGLYDRLAAGNYIDESKITAQSESLSPGSLVSGFKAGTLVPSGYSPSEGFAAATSPAQSIWNDLTPGSSALSLSLGGGAGPTNAGHLGVPSTNADSHGRGIASGAKAVATHTITPVGGAIALPAKNEPEVEVPIVPKGIPAVATKPIMDPGSLGDAFSDGAVKGDHDSSSPAGRNTTPRIDEPGSYARALTAMVEKDRDLTTVPSLAGVGKVTSLTEVGYANGSGGGLVDKIVSYETHNQETKEDITSFVSSYFSCGPSQQSVMTKARRKKVLTGYFTSDTKCFDVVKDLQTNNKARLSNGCAGGYNRLEAVSTLGGNTKAAETNSFTQLRCIAADIAAANYACAPENESEKPFDAYLVEAKFQLAAASQLRGNKVKFTGSSSDLKHMYGVAVCGKHSEGEVDCPNEVDAVANEMTWSLMVSAARNFRVDTEKPEVIYSWIAAGVTAAGKLGCDFSKPVKAIGQYMTKLYHDESGKNPNSKRHIEETGSLSEVTEGRIRSVYEQRKGYAVSQPQVARGRP